MYITISGGEPKPKKRNMFLEVDDGFSNGQVSLNSPWQVKQFGHDELEDLVHIDVMFST